MIEPRKVLLTLLVLGITGSLVAVSALSAFSSTTDNPGNEFAAGTVDISDNDAGSAMYDVTDQKPGVTIERCIKVTYTGSLAADVKLYTTDALDTLAPYVNLTVTPGTQAVSVFPGCTDFVADAGGSIFSGTLQGFAAAHSGWADGLADHPGAGSSWGAGSAVVYRLQLTLADDNDANGGSDALTTGEHAFTWEARNQ
ncbi:MAG: TasA family protein [Thermoleophilaceae bacterium]